MSEGSIEASHRVMKGLSIIGFSQLELTNEGDLQHMPE